MGEDRYYPVVRRWLEKDGYYCGGAIEDRKGRPIYYENKGTKRLRIDVAGIKNVGTSLLDEIEIVAVEVRDVGSVQSRDIQDACGYSQYAHKCYLATTGTIDKQDREEASSLGVGLLKIKNREVHEALSPMPHQPKHSKMMHFLHNLDVSQCPICGCFFETYTVKSENYRSYQKLKRTKYFNAARDFPKVNTFVNSERRNLPSNYKVTRYMCWSCLQQLFPHLIGKDVADEEV